MKNLILIILFFPLSIFSQVINNLVVFSNEGEKFTLILNGEKQNSYPATKVRVVDLNLEVYKVTILFEDKYFKTHITTLTFYGTNNECHFALNRHGKKHTMDYVTSNKINPELEVKKEKTVTPPNNNTNSNDSNNSQNENTNTSQDNTSNGNTDVNINTNNGNIGVGNNGVSIQNNGIKVNVDPKNKSTSTSVNVLGKDINISKSLKTGCKSPISSLEFTEEKKKIELAIGDTLRYGEVEKISGNNCLTTAQVKEMMGLFNSELYRLKVAKLCYSKTSDPSTYGKLEDEFKTEEGKRDLKNFIKNQ